MYAASERYWIMSENLLAALGLAGDTSQPKIWRVRSKTITERFWEKVHITDGCWEWMARRKLHGYGEFRIIDCLVPAHRMAWVLSVGPIPKGLLVLHRCDNPPCCNPDHLFLGTQADNLRDAIQKGRLVLTARKPRKAVA